MQKILDGVLGVVKMGDMLGCYITNILLQPVKWAFGLVFGAGSRRMWAGRLTKRTSLKHFGLGLLMVGSERAVRALRLAGLVG